MSRITNEQIKLRDSVTDFRETGLRHNINNDTLMGMGHSLFSSLYLFSYLNRNVDLETVDALAFSGVIHGPTLL